MQAGAPSTMTERGHLLELPAEDRETIRTQVFLADRQQPSSLGRWDPAGMIVQPDDVYSIWIKLLQGAVYAMHTGKYERWRGILRTDQQLHDEAVTQSLGKPVIMPGTMESLRTSIVHLDSLARHSRTLWITDLTDWNDASEQHGRCATSANIIAITVFNALVPRLKELPLLDTIILDTAALLGRTNIHRCLQLLRHSANAQFGANQNGDALDCFAAIVQCAASSNINGLVKLPATVICANFFQIDRRWTPSTLPEDSDSDGWTTVLDSMLWEGCIILSDKSVNES